MGEICDEITQLMKNLVITAYRQCKEINQTIHFMVPYFGCIQMLMDDVLFLVIKAFNIAASVIMDEGVNITDAVHDHFKAINIS